MQPYKNQGDAQHVILIGRRNQLIHGAELNDEHTHTHTRVPVAQAT